MQTLIVLVVGVLIGVVVYSLIHEDNVKKREIPIEAVSNWTNAKMCENCRCAYNSLSYLSCPQCGSSYSQVFFADLLDTGVEKIEMWKQHKKDIREGKFKTRPKVDESKVIMFEEKRPKEAASS